MSTELTITSEQRTWTPAQKSALQQLGVEGANSGDLEVYFHQAQRTGLDPFKREIYMIKRSGKQTIQTGIDGFYKIADRAARSRGSAWGITETLWCGPDGQWVDVWLHQQAPSAAKVTLERDGARFVTVAVTAEYQAPNPMWKKMPARMIAKCAEALAIRKAFPEDLSGIYSSEEMQQADNNTPAPQQSRPVQVREPAQGGLGSRVAPVEGEIVDQGEQITDDQWAAVQEHLEAQGVTESAERAKWVQEYLDRRISSPKAITKDEADRMLADLTGKEKAA